MPPEATFASAPQQAFSCRPGRGGQPGCVRDRGRGARGRPRAAVGTHDNHFGTTFGPLRDGRGLLLLEFDSFFDYPSEVFCNKAVSGEFTRCFRRKDFAVTDVSIVESGPAFIAGFQPVGLLARTPVPGKVRIGLSPDFVSWTDCEVDYRAVAGRVMLAVVDAQHAWAATDTGMILRHKP